MKKNSVLQILSFTKRKEEKQQSDKEIIKPRLILYWLNKNIEGTLKDVKVISGELQHGLVLTDIIKKKMMKEIKRKRII